MLRDLPHVRLALAGAVLTFAGGARAAPSLSCPALAAANARARYESLDLAGVVEATSDLDACPDGTGAELAQALRWRAQALVTKGNLVAAEETFARLETFAPGFQLDPALSPRLHEAHQAGKARAVTERRVIVRLGNPKPGAAGAQVFAEVFSATPGPLEVLIQFEDGTGVKPVAASEVTAGQYQATAPGGATGAYRVLVRREGEPVFLSPYAHLPMPAAPPPRAELLAPRDVPAARAPDLTHPRPMEAAAANPARGGMPKALPWAFGASAVVSLGFSGAFAVLGATDKRAFDASVVDGVSTLPASELSVLQNRGNARFTAALTTAIVGIALGSVSAAMLASKD